MKKLHGMLQHNSLYPYIYLHENGLNLEYRMKNLTPNLVLTYVVVLYLTLEIKATLLLQVLKQEHPYAVNYRQYELQAAILQIYVSLSLFALQLLPNIFQ